MHSAEIDASPIKPLIFFSLYRMLLNIEGCFSEAQPLVPWRHLRGAMYYPDNNSRDQLFLGPKIAFSAGILRKQGLMTLT